MAELAATAAETKTVAQNTAANSTVDQKRRYMWILNCLRPSLIDRTLLTRHSAATVRLSEQFRVCSEPNAHVFGVREETCNSRPQTGIQPATSVR